MAIQPGWGEQWNTLSTAINEYYGGGVESVQYQQVVNMLNSGNYTMEEMESILGNIPEFSRTYNSAGQLTNVSYNVSTSASNAASNIAQEINSNVANSSKTQFSSVQTITKNPQTGTVTISDDVIKYKTGQLAPTTMKTVGASALAAVCATGVGISLGKTIDATLYNLNPDFWEDRNMGYINPETWSSITVDNDSINAKLFNMIFGIDDTTGNPQAYISEDAFAYLTAYMGSRGVFTTNESSSSIDPSKLFNENYTPQPMYMTSSTIVIEDLFADKFDNRFRITIQLPSNVRAFGYTDAENIVHLFFGATSSTSIIASRYNYRTGIDDPNWRTINLTTPYITKSGNTFYAGDRLSLSYIENEAINFVAQYSDWGDSKFDEDSCAMLFEGDITIVDGVPGITPEIGATQFDPSQISDYTNISAVLDELKRQYPELWDNRVEVSPDGTTTLVYVPIGFPTGGNGTQPTTIGASQLDTSPDISGKGSNATDELIKTLIDALTHPSEGTGMEGDTNTPTKPVDPNGDPRGTGENPPIVPPIGSASALWKIYNPSQSQLDAFGAWLWSSNFVDQLLKLFNDPMQAIIGLHKVFCAPPISGSGPIKVGYLVSDASANYVSNQYTEIDCGEIDMKEHFGNVFDYDGFTRVSIFLPFIGFRDLDTKDVMRGKMNIKYGVDVLTGACLAKIKITRDLNSPILYTFEGNCAVQYPVSSGSYIGIVTGVLGIAGSIAGTFATGGAMAPALLRAGAALPNIHSNVQHSGNISSNVGALGPKKPYVVIQRPQTQMPQNGILIEGEGQNETALLGSLTGFVRVKKADYNGIPGTSNELNEIRDLLEKGIYMS